MKYFYLTLTALAFTACSAPQPSRAAAPGKQVLPEQTSLENTESAIFAGGCFWCTESDFEKVPGVIAAISGYTGGYVENPTYQQVSRTKTGHYEAVKVIFDPSKVSYKDLVDHYWMTVDPTDPNGQFCDKGDSYRTAIFVTPEQKDIADASKQRISDTKPFSDPIVTPIIPAKTFYDAEDYHQDYYKKNSLKYKFYRKGCGRDNRLKQLWGDKN